MDNSWKFLNGNGYYVGTYFLYMSKGLLLDLQDLPDDKIQKFY